MKSSIAVVAAWSIVFAAGAYGCATSSNSDNGGGGDSGASQDASGDGHAGDASKDGATNDAATQDGSMQDGAQMDAGIDAPFTCMPVMVADAGSADSGSDAASDAAADASDAAMEAGDDGGDAEAGVDAGTDSGVDAGICTPPQPGVCGPGDVSGFQPTWHPPTGAHQGACTTAQFPAYYTACLDPNATVTTCDAFTQANAACAACITTDDTAAQYGPLVNRTQIGVVSVNVAGCIALLEPCNLGCAQAYAANDECTETSCGPNCPVVDDISFQDYQACTQTADQCGCATRNASAQCVTQLTGSQHPAGQCLAGTTFQQFYDFVAPLFCGP
jgi:hypothetical protein